MLGQHHVLIGCAGVVAAAAVSLQSGQYFGDPGSVLLFNYDLPQAPFLLGAAAVGSLLPDVDQPKAMLANFSPLLKPVFFLPSHLLPHRGPTHSLLVWAILTLLCTHWGAQVSLYYWAVAASLGYLLHLAADSLTTSGIPLLWPLYGRHVGLPPNRHLRFATGSPTEYLVVGILLGATLVLVQQTGWPLP